jgi:hypothetical protein
LVIAPPNRSSPWAGTAAVFAILVAILLSSRTAN